VSFSNSMSSLKRWFPQWKQRYSNLESFSEDDEKSSSNGLLPDSEASSQDSPYFNRREQQSGPSRRVFYGSLLLNCVFLIGCGVLAGQTWPQLKLKMHDPFNNYLLKQVSMPCKFIGSLLYKTFLSLCFFQLQFWTIFTYLLVL
jgi:hypothetical protein